MKTEFATLAAAAFLALAAAPMGAAPAAAADGKVMAAADCFARSGTVATSRGTLENTSIVLPVVVRCALVRDNPTVVLSKVEVNVIDQTSALLDLNDDDFFCSVAMVDKFGKTTASGATRKSIGVNSAGTTLLLPVPATNHAKGNYIVTCKIPRKGALDPAPVFASIYYEEVQQP
jgi:hypothetical protein